LVSRHGERKRWDETTKDLIHQVSDVGAGERVSLQPLSDKAASHWDRACSLSYGTSDKDLVPESAYEVEEGTQDGEHEHRAVPHVAVRAPLPVRAPPWPVRSLGHIGRVLARRARSTRCPVPRDVRRAELLKGFFRLRPRATSRRCHLWLGGVEGNFTSSRTHGAFRWFRNASMVGLSPEEREIVSFFSYMSITYLNYLRVCCLFVHIFSLAESKEELYRETWERKILSFLKLSRNNPFSLSICGHADTQVTVTVWLRSWRKAKIFCIYSAVRPT